MSIPFHKQMDPDKQAGQVVFSPVALNTKPELYLRDYIEKKQDNPKRITFTEWAKQHDVNGLPLSLHGLSDNEWQFMETIWNTALTRGKL